MSPSTQESSSVTGLLFTHQAHCLSGVFMSPPNLTTKCNHCYNWTKGIYKPVTHQCHWVFWNTGWWSEQGHCHALVHSGTCMLARTDEPRTCPTYFLKGVSNIEAFCRYSWERSQRAQKVMSMTANYSMLDHSAAIFRVVQSTLKPNSFWENN